MVRKSTLIPIMASVGRLPFEVRALLGAAVLIVGACSKENVIDASDDATNCRINERRCLSDQVQICDNVDGKLVYVTVKPCQPGTCNPDRTTCCNDYQDDMGHLTTTAASAIGEEIGLFYASNLPDP